MEAEGHHPWPHWSPSEDRDFQNTRAHKHTRVHKKKRRVVEEEGNLIKKSLFFRKTSTLWGPYPLQKAKVSLGAPASPARVLSR